MSDPTDFVVPFDFDEITISDESDKEISPTENDIAVGGIQFRLDVNTVEELVEASKAYERMLDQTRDLVITRGTPIEGNGGQEYISGSASYKFHTANRFTNLADLSINGRHQDMDTDWMEVVIWSCGQGLTFRAYSEDDSFTVNYGCSRSDLEEHLQLVSGRRTAP